MAKDFAWRFVANLDGDPIQFRSFIHLLSSVSSFKRVVLETSCKTKLVLLARGFTQIIIAL